MAIRLSAILCLLGMCFLTQQGPEEAHACCAVYAVGKPVVNADQTVIILWDVATKTQHFIRQASFKGEADDFGFLVPSPTQPELSESGNEEFPYLRKVTDPEKKLMPRRLGMSCGCSAAMPARDAEIPALEVKVLEEKLVAGFNAAVLETTSTTALVKWLKDNGYAFSPEVAAWAKPHVEAGWKITALKVAKSKDDPAKKDVKASSLRISFKTDRPLFPYREPEYKGTAESVGAKRRPLRIYFIAEARYEGVLTKETPWTVNAAWSGKLTQQDRKKLLEALYLPLTTGPAEWWLTEFEDEWPYTVAPADVYFSRSANQDRLTRPPVTRFVATPYPTDATAYALAAVMIVPPLWIRLRRRPS